MIYNPQHPMEERSTTVAMWWLSGNEPVITGHSRMDLAFGLDRRSVIGTKSDSTRTICRCGYKKEEGRSLPLFSFFIQYGRTMPQ